MTYVLWPKSVRTPPMLPDCNDYYRLQWTPQPGREGFLHVSVTGRDSNTPAVSSTATSALPTWYTNKGPTSLRLRDYQDECVRAVLSAWERAAKAPLVVAPTGCGKTIIAAEIMRQVYAGRGARCLFLAHRNELIEQTYDKVYLVTSQSERTPRIGIVQASKDELDRNITVASIQTLASRTGRRIERLLTTGAPYDYVICDEAHHAVSPQWMRVLDALNTANPDVRFVGMTATPGRADGTALDRVFTEVCFERGVLDMIQLGYLVPPHGFKITLDVNLDRVATENGDFVRTQLAKLMNRPPVLRAVVEAWRAHGHNRKTLVFAVDVAHAIALRNEFVDAGYAAEHVDGRMKARERKAVFERFKTGQTKILCNCEIATEGFDDPSIEAVLLVRPTQSQALFAQMVGRGLRLWPGKTECLLLDCVGNSDRHRLATLATLAGFDPAMGAEGESETPVTEEGDDVQLPIEINAVGMRVEEVDFSHRPAQTRYQWRETSIGWVLQIPRIGYYLVAWAAASHIKCVIRFYDQRPGRQDSPPREVLKDPVDFELAYGLVEAEMDRIFRARVNRGTARSRTGHVFERTDDNEFADSNTSSSDMPEINFVDLDEGVDDPIHVPEVLMMRSADWRSQPPTAKQLEFLTTLGVKEGSLPTTCGEASDLITILRIERDAKMRLPATPKQLAYLRVNELPIKHDMTKGAAARLIWQHRKARRV